MYCSTCGALVPSGRRACSECGTPASAAVARAGAHRPAGPIVSVCPRCGYHGAGVSYFSRGSHLALLIGITVLTLGAMGAGGLIYFVLRHDHRICPRCGLSWGKKGELSLATAGPGSTKSLPEIPLSRNGFSVRGGSIMLLVVAAFLMIFGIAEAELLTVLLGALAGGGAWVLHRSARAEREARRVALLSSLQLPVLKLARRRDGRLTVTEVAAELGWTLPRAEKVLESLNDGYRVSSEVTNEGVIVYEFLELKYGRDRLPEIEG